MGNYKMTLQYEGTRYQGWQRQESTGNTIQGRLEALLSKMTGQQIEVQGSGRTDAGVHALGQVANFHADTEMTPEEMLEYINRYLPEDIGVISLERVPERFHSRLNAKGKTYCYRVIGSGLPHVFDRRFAHITAEKLDVDAMRRASEYLLGTHDFKAFTSNKRGKKSTVRTIEEIRVEKADSFSMRGKKAGDEIRFIYRGNGFLYHMVRIMTGTLLEVGTHKRKPEEIPEILASGNRENAGELAPAKGLTLMEVRY
ncbi:MAG: tRNA pseudouridine(38-40) synthase TruA [Lachnospiraceae bacterium]|nr:tRNA pseudouridine(38-40) synthase TruA [Lachnospiraceae bacterium]